jgi:hypothetical protein
MGVADSKEKSRRTIVVIAIAPGRRSSSGDRRSRRLLPNKERKQIQKRDVTSWRQTTTPGSSRRTFDTRKQAAARWGKHRQEEQADVLRAINAQDNTCTRQRAAPTADGPHLGLRTACDETENILLCSQQNITVHAISADSNLSI